MGGLAGAEGRLLPGMTLGLVGMGIGIAIGIVGTRSAVAIGLRRRAPEKADCEDMRAREGVLLLPLLPLALLPLLPPPLLLLVMATMLEYCRCLVSVLRDRERRPRETTFAAQEALVNTFWRCKNGADGCCLVLGKSGIVRSRRDFVTARYY